MNKFTIALLGAAGSGKSSFIAGLSKLNILEYITAKNRGGANTTKVSTIYEFSNKYDRFSVSDCICTDGINKDEFLLELQGLCEKEEGIKEIFKNINSSSFAKKCTSITIKLPCKENIIPKNNLIDTMSIIDSRGFGDIDDKSDLKSRDVDITSDVNAIVFFAVSPIEQPATISQVIEEVINVNLKTPIFFLRRCSEETDNDYYFERNILENIKSKDKALYDVVLEVSKDEIQYKINGFVFDLPLVKKWMGVRSVDDKEHEKQVEEYTNAIKNFLSYSVSMYDKLYEKLIDKMNGEYLERFIDEILKKMLSIEAFDVVAKITETPTSRPGSGYNVFRDTEGLRIPVKLKETDKIGEAPFVFEKSTHGNQYKDGIIPSYSYSCVNFRNVFRDIVQELAKGSSSSRALFSTFIDILLSDYTVTADTGYSLKSCRRDAFKFDKILLIRDICTKILSENGLVEEGEIWKEFVYTPIEDMKTYTGIEAIAIFMYRNLVNSLELSYKFNTLHSEEMYKSAIKDIKKKESIELIKRK